MIARSLMTILILLTTVDIVGAIEWNAGVGDFQDGSNWSSGSVPSSPDGCVVTNGGTAQLAGGLVDVSEFTLGYADGTGRFEQTGGDFIAAASVIGQQGEGTAQISGGVFAIGGDSIHVGWMSTGVGEMIIDGFGAIVTSGDDFQLGREGTGTLNFSAGQLRAGYTVIAKYGTGTWNQTGGLFDQDFGDVEIGDGGGDDNASVDGPRTGIMNVSGGFVQTSGHLAIGNRSGNGTVNISGGMLAMTGKPDSSIYVGRGMNTSPGNGGETELRLIGDASSVFANGGFFMNPESAATSSTLVAEITGPSHSTIRVAGSADISNGTLKIVLNDYVPTQQDVYTLIEAGVDLSSDIAAFNAGLDVDGYDESVHEPAAELGSIAGTFLEVDTSEAPLPPGLLWEVAYTGNHVFLGVVPGELPSVDLDKNGIIDVADIDLLMNAVAAGTPNPRFDLNGDGNVNDADRDQWLAEAGPANGLAGPYLLGDANLDATVNAADLNVLGISWQSDNANWSQGNFTGSDSNAADLNAVGLNWQQTVNPAAAAIPEPSANFLAIAMAIALVVRRRIDDRSADR